MSSPPLPPGSPPPLREYGSTPPTTRRQGQRGLAIAALVLGLGAVVLSPLLIGSVLGVIGVVLGAIYSVDRKPPFAAAFAGIVLSIIGVGLSVYFAQFYFGRVQQFVQSTVAEAQEDLSHWEELEAPDFAARTLEDDTVALSQWRGQPVIIVAWGMFPPGMDAFSGERLSDAAATLIQWYKSNPDAAQVIGVTTEWPEELLQRLVNESGATFPNAIVNELPPPYDRAVFPTAFFVDPDGNFSAIEKLPVTTEMLDAHVAPATTEDTTSTDDPGNDVDQADPEPATAR